MANYSLLKGFNTDPENDKQDIIERKQEKEEIKK